MFFGTTIEYVEAARIVLACSAAGDARLGI
jgi:hypothetical protein